MLVESAKRKERAQAMRQAGKTLQEIGTALGVSTQRAAQILNGNKKSGTA